jgi:hypothetical protein
MDGEKRLLLQISSSLNAIVKALLLIYWLLLGSAIYGLIKLEHITWAQWWLLPVLILIWLLGVTAFLVRDARKSKAESKGTDSTGSK